MLKNNLLNDEEGSSGLYYSLIVVALILFSVAFGVVASLAGESISVEGEDWYLILSFMVSPLAIISATLLFAYLRGESPLQSCGIQKCKVKYYWIALVAFAVVFLGLGNLNTIFVEFLSKRLGYAPSTMALPEFSAVNYILVVLTVCLLPAVTEEIAMRGIVLKGIKSGNVIVSAVLGGLLFSLFHMSPMQTPYQFAIGFIFSLIAIKSGSTLPTIIAHFLNNFTIITIEYFSPTLFASWGNWMLTFIIPAIIGFVFIVAVLVRDGNNKEKTTDEGLKNFFMGAIAGIFVCTFMWTMSLLG